MKLVILIKPLLSIISVFIIPIWMIIHPSVSLSDQSYEVLILYPETPSPYREVFSQIIEGISLSTVPVHAIPVSSSSDIGNLQRWINKNMNTLNTLVLLGNRALSVSKELQHNLKVFGGVIDILPNKDHISGISAHIHPSKYLSRLKQLMPKINNLVVFYNEKDKYYIPLLEQEARKEGVNLKVISITDVREAASQIAVIMPVVESDGAAIWFMRDVIDLNTELLFPFVIEETWKRRIPVFSNMISHAKRGFLFSLYPDYKAVGEELGLLIKTNAGNYKHAHDDLHLITTIKFALNIRTAQHLKLPIDSDTLRDAAVIFPAR